MDGTVLQCLSLYEADKKTHSRGAVLKAKDYPEYFNVINADAGIITEDAQNDPRTSKMAEHYLKKAGITSMLDCGIFKGGKLVGVVSTEHTGHTRRWYPDEEAFVKAVAPFIARSLTERDTRKYKKELGESQQLLDSVIKNIPDIIYRLDREGRIIFISESVKTYGYNPSEMIGRDIFDYIYPEDRDSALHKVNERRTGKRKTDSFEIRLIPRDNGHRDFGVISGSIQKQPVFLLGAEGLYQDGIIQDSNFIGTQGVARDITALKRAEDSLRESERKVRTILDSSFELIALLSPEGIILEINQTALNFAGVRLIDVTGKFFWETPWWSFDKNMQNRIQSAVAVVSSGEIVRSDAVHPYVDGTLHTIDFTLKPITDDKGKIVWLIAEGRDITEGKKAEEALIKSESLLKEAEQIAGVGAWSVDYVSKAVTGSDGLAGIYELDPGYTLTFGENFVAPEWKEIIKELYRAQLENGEQQNLEYEIVTVKGNRKWVRSSIVAVRNESGKIIQLLGAIQDITSQKQAESEREKLQAQLTQVQKMEAVGRLAGGVAHDFNNMLSVILGNLEIAMIDIPEESQLRKRIDTVLDAANRSADLTRQLLAFARKQTITPKLIDLNNTVKGILKMLRRLIREDIDISWIPDNNLEKLVMDPSQVDQLLANLCINAQDAISGTGKITIETQSVFFDETCCAENDDFNPGRYIMLAVSDNGCGMDKKTLISIFEPFFTTKPTGKGVGLGLSTVYGIVKQNNGFIKVYSEPGYGTTFRLYLPLKTRSVAWHTETAKAPSSGGGLETILIVEDEPNILEVTKTMLRRLGYTVFAAATPEEAIGMAGEKTAKINLLISDVVMPGMNCRDLASSLLSIQPDLKCLFMSGYTANVIAHHNILEEGINFIQKPFTMKDLGNKVREILDNGNQVD